MIIGIDPGNTGAVAVLSRAGKFLRVFDTPLKEEGRGNIIDANDLLYDLEELYVDTVFLEKVHAMPNQGVTSMFNFGQGYGIIKGVLGCLGYDYTLVTPQAWKKHHGLLKTDKDAARLKAIELFPEAEQYLQRKKDIGRADALLIAAYGYSLEN